MRTPLHARIAAARDTLVRAGLQPSNAATDAAVLARHALGWDRATLLARGREAPPPSFDASFDSFVARRAAREPVAMITGGREFWGLDFEVTPDVLVPRPETEFIVEEALAEFSDHPRRIIDVGTGTGCLAVALSREFPEAHVIATDISAGALAVAQRNAIRHEVSDRIGFVRAHFLSGVGGPVDLIVSNPPYVPDSAVGALAPEIVLHEPHTALFSGGDGLSAIRELLATAETRLAPNGRLIMEFGFGQEPEVTALADDSRWRVLRLREDLQGIPRVIVLGRS
jgi:release factor glutamine methyltransferase